MNDQNDHDDNNHDDNRAALLQMLAGLLDTLDEALQASRAHDDQERVTRTAGLTIQATSPEGDTVETHETFEDAAPGVSMAVLTRLLLGISPALAAPLSQLLIPIRRDIVALMIGQRRAEGIFMVTFQVHHHDTCECPEGLNYITLMHHPQYKTHNGEPFEGVLTVGIYEDEASALEGHAAWQDKLNNMELHRLPDTIEGRMNPTDEAQTTIYRADVPLTIQ